jgi:hypothetical protein
MSVMSAVRRCAMMQPRQQHKMLLVQDGNTIVTEKRYETFYNIILKWNAKLDRKSKKMKVYESSLCRLHTGGFISCIDRSV